MISSRHITLIVLLSLYEFQGAVSFFTRIQRRRNSARHQLRAQENPDDPRAFRRRKRQEAFLEKKKMIQANQDMDLPDTAEAELTTTIAGGTSMIFAMARRMWQEQQQYQQQQQISTMDAATHESPIAHEFRSKSPVMNQQTYAGQIWRNVRKQNKPSLWKYALRVYDRMEPSTRGVIHDEGALLACAKLGLADRAHGIMAQATTVTDHMLTSTLRASVRASRRLASREPLDAAVEIMRRAQASENLTIEARHINPLAAAYAKLSFLTEAQQLLNEYLGARVIGPESEDTDENDVNVFDIGCRDKGSYALAVQGALQDGDFEGAIDALRNMTQAGLYPVDRHLHVWNEMAQKSLARQR